MDIRKTTMADLEEVLDLYEEARQFMRENGNPNQWGTSHPSKEQVMADIEKGCSYVCQDEGRLVGVFYFAREREPDYDRIYEGNWQKEEPYGVMHRVASPGRKKGAASFCVQWCLEKSDGNLRIDTHRKNIPMQKMLEKNGFVYCGIIYLSNGEERLAYQHC